MSMNPKNLDQNQIKNRAIALVSRISKLAQRGEVTWHQIAEPWALANARYTAVEREQYQLWELARPVVTERITQQYIQERQQ